MSNPINDPEADDPLDTLIDAWLTLSEAAEALGVSPNRVRQWARERELSVVRTAASREPRVPAAMIADGAITKGLGGTLTLLSDSGYDEREALVWLFTADDSLPGRPIDALREDRGKEVRRRAQAMAF
ncbi:Rv2175c family DNA-binding protein [Solicola gregarius]|uniref:Rv2175c family DNA-binding protein n=1 Tax=Solicola gregarius TaxID=2908642 RepID=A0AA46TIA7_9ACTN|nr:Rv2175c family DNA-binding protein [Solicola gregarius]UYM05374.1 Rv2175c family DNA-binding protein [Solicola gregarius]